MATVDRLETRFEMIGLVGAVRGLHQYSQALKQASNQGLNLTNAQIARQQQSILKMEQNLLFLGETAAVAFGATMVSALVNAQMEAEKLHMQMMGLFGNQGASQTDSFMTRFAAETHQSLEDVRKLVLTLGRLNVQPTHRLLSDIVKLSNMSGKALEQVAEAVGKALQGEPDALKEYGITKRDIRNQGYGPDGTMKAIENATKGVSDSGSGIIAALKDFNTAWTKLSETLGQSSLPAALINLGTFFLNIINSGIMGIRLLTESLQIFLQEMLKWTNPNTWRNGGRDKVVDKMKQQFAEDWKRYLGIYGSGASEPGKLQHSSAGNWNPMGEMIQQILGTGPIGRIGIKASELPGLSPRAHSPITIRVAGDKTLENLFNQLLDRVNRHGYTLQPNH